MRWLLVDSGAICSVVPSSILRKLGVKPHSRQVFTLADGSHVTQRKGDLLFRLDGSQGMAPVIFGEKDDSTLLGVVSLEALGLILDSLKRELRPAHGFRRFCSSVNLGGSLTQGS